MIAENFNELLQFFGCLLRLKRAVKKLICVNAVQECDARNAD